jgi:hypothetical protein
MLGCTEHSMSNKKNQHILFTLKRRYKVLDYHRMQICDCNDLKKLSALNKGAL